MFALADCNNFYASCERVFNPYLKDKAIVVLSNNDGCVIARSNEAKAMGIPMGAPAFEFEKLFADNKVYVYSSNYALYGDMSNRVMMSLANYTPEIEIYSIDEAFLKFTGFHRYDMNQYALTIRETVSVNTGIPISIGVAPTKALAKVANKIAKKHMGITKGAYVIDNKDKLLKAIKWLKIQDVWGIGSRHAHRLNKIGVETAYDFTQLDDSWVLKNMTVVGLRLKHELEGKSRLDLEETSAKKNIATTRSFKNNIKTYLEIKERISTYAVSCAEKLRNQKSDCCSILVFIHTNRHRNDLQQYSKNILLKLPFPTNSSIEISKMAIKALKLIYRDGYEYKKAGVIVMDIKPENRKQISIFCNSDPRHKKLMNAMDSLNKSIGQQKVKLANMDPARTWKMRQERLSPRYTTRLNEIIKVKA